MTDPQTQTLALTGLTLRVRDLERQLAFYCDLLGLEALRSQPTLGLYHFALLLPDREALAAVFRRLLEARYPNFQGTSDHGISASWRW